MRERFDSFPVNMFETAGPIERKGFNFQCSEYRIWAGGRVIQQGKTSFIVQGQTINGTLIVNVHSEIFNQYLSNNLFYFEDISLSQDRILWLNANQSAKVNQPTALSLFFKKSILARVAITIDIPQILIEIDGVF